MTDTIFFITTIILVILVVEFYHVLNLRMLMHPGFYFAIIWMIAVPSQWYLMQHGLALTPHPEYIDELNVFVAFTAICFLFIIRLGGKKKFSRNIEFNFIQSANLYKFLLYLTFFSVLLNFLYSLIFLGISLNLGITRGVITSDVFRARSTVVFERLLSYGSIFYPLVAILGGYFFGRKIQRLPSLITSNRLIFLPVIIPILQVLTTGGRNPLATGLKYYLFGFAITLTRNLDKRIRGKIIFWGLISIISFSLFTTIVGNQRDQVFKNNSQTYQSIKNPLLKQFSGVMSYMSAHYWGYQIRRNDTYDPKSLGYGYYTFYGVFSAGIPFSSLIGINGNLGTLLGLENNKLDYFVLKNKNIDGYYTTKSIFIEIICDFGLPGTYIFIALFTFYTHFLFLSVFKKPFRKATGLYFFLLCTMYWSSSNFQSFYAIGSVIGFIIMLWLFDKIQKLFFRRKFKVKKIVEVNRNQKIEYKLQQ